MRDLWSDSCYYLEDPLFIVSTEGIIVEANRAAAKAAKKSLEDMRGASVCNILHGGRLPHIECPLEQFLRTFSGRVMETNLPGLFGDYLLHIVTTSYIREGKKLLVILARELTREEARKIEYHRTAQLAAIGELAAGVAHEVNNPINGIINFAQLMLDENQNEGNRDLLERIVSEGERIASITHKLLCFAKEDQEDKELLTIKEVIEGCLNLILNQFRSDGIEICCEYPMEMCQFSGNSNMLQQVFFNLLSNCRHALNQKYSGHDPNKKIIIKCDNVLFDQGSGTYIRVQVKDFGSGIPQGLLDRVYDPFFTTKPCGEGTGLGLSISHGIIKEHGGTMKIESVLHEYTSITIDFPAVGQCKASC